MNKIKAWWASLDHYKQGAIIAFGLGVGTAIEHAAQTEGLTHCQDWACVGSVLKTIVSPHVLFPAIGAGLVGLKLFLMTPNRQQPPDPPAQSEPHA